MSFDTLAWAARQRLDRSSDKLILLGLAESANRGHGLSFPSIAALVEFSSLDRKTVILALSRLVRRAAHQGHCRRRRQPVGVR